MRILLLRVLAVGLWLGVGFVGVGNDNDDDDRWWRHRDDDRGRRHRDDHDGWWRRRDGISSDPGAATKSARFVSADARAGEAGFFPGGAAATTDQAPAMSASDSTSPAEGLEGLSANRSVGAVVVEGDIYRVLGDGTILNLNRYRGLQVIDVSDPDAPEVVGSYSVQGNPEELYVRGDRAFVLLNNWRGYYGSRGDVGVERREGGLLLAIDLSEPTDPKLLDSLVVPGRVRRSRMVTDGDAAALYVVSSFVNPPEAEDDFYWTENTAVTSFDVTGSTFVKRDELDLGGYVQDIQATPNALLVATNDWTQEEDTNEVSVVDIGHADGLMFLGDTVRVNGYIESQFNMDLHEGILRVVSTNWDGDQTNVVETFDARDITTVTPIDACAFGAGQDLYATLFLKNKAFFVTYLRIDPFHAFEIDAEGHCQEQGEFVVSGWNDFFRPVADQTRLIGIGTNDEDGGRTPAVSLYDVTNLSNPKPLLARAQAGQLQWSSSEANYDHRAFSVLEGAVSVQSKDGIEETGLVLLPFRGYTAELEGQPGQSVSGVQIFTFSDATVTARAAMEHNTPVRRSFLAGDTVTANLSEQALSLFDHSDPDAPEPLGSVDLAPDYGRVLAFGDYLARLHRPTTNYYYDFEASASDESIPTAQVDIIPANADPNTTDVVASFDVPVDARLLKTGDALAAISYRVIACEQWPCAYNTSVTLFDLSDPTSPVAAGDAQADDLSPSYVNFGGNPYYGGGSFIGCGVGPAWFSGNQVDGIFALGDAIAFTATEQNRETIGMERHCSVWPLNECIPFESECEVFFEGYRSCSTIDDGPEVCREDFYACSSADFESTCDPIDIEEVPLSEEECREFPRERYWTTYNFKVLDVSDLQDPRFGDLIRMPRTDESTRVLPSDESLFYTYRNPIEVADDVRPHVAYYFRELDFSDPSQPGVGSPVNIPGELIAVDGDQLYTRDLRWGKERAESYLHELTLVGDMAEVGASQRFEDRQVLEVLADGDRLLVSHRAVFSNDIFSPFDFPLAISPPGLGLPVAEPSLDRLTIFSQRGLAQLGELEIDRWTTLEAAHGGKALYSVPGGMMLFNFEDPTSPYAQAYFPVSGWPEQILFESSQITITAGPYGIHRFQADVFNLLAP